MTFDRSALKEAKRIVVKVGTSTITYANGKRNFEQIDRLARELADLQNQGKEMILVTSGAVAVGVDRLGLSEKPKTIPGKQAAAAVGQGILMRRCCLLKQNLWTGTAIQIPATPLWSC